MRTLGIVNSLMGVCTVSSYISTSSSLQPCFVVAHSSVDLMRISFTIAYNMLRNLSDISYEPEIDISFVR